MPKTVPPYILELKKQYEDASTRLWKIVKEKDAAGRASKYYADLAAQADLELTALDKFVVRWTYELVKGDYFTASRNMLAQMRETIGVGDVKTNVRNIQAIADNLSENLRAAHRFAGRKIKDDIWRGTFEGLQQKNMQGMTQPQTKNEILRRFAEKGVLHIEDKNGKSIPLTSYAEMVSRTTHAEIVNRGVVEEVVEAGEDLVQMSSHASTCPTCAIYEGRVYSISGKSRFYPPLDKAFGGSEYANIHPNCIHTLTPYVPSLDPDVIKTREFSRRPFKEDDYTRKATKGYREAQKKKTILNNDRKEWMRMVAELGDDAPKTLSAYRAMKRANSQKFKDLKSRMSVIKKPVTTAKLAKDTQKVVVPPKPKTLKDKIDDLRKASTSVGYTQDDLIQVGKLVAEEHAKFGKSAIVKPIMDELATVKNERWSIDEIITTLRQERDTYINVLNGYVPLASSGYNSMGEVRVLADEISNRIRESMKLRDDLRAKLVELKNKLEAVSYNPAKELADTIAKIRPVGLGKRTKNEILENFSTKSPMVPHVVSAYELYPSKWVDASYDWGQLEVKKVNRGHYRHSGKGYGPAELYISDYGAKDGMSSAGSVAVHEIGHRMERMTPEIMIQEEAFYKYRTNGETAEWLGPGYERREVARKDKFVSIYMGKDYGGSAYELVSMGFQMAYTAPEELMRDMEMYHWILGMLAVL